MQPWPKLILVPTDFTETAAHALRYASALAARAHAHLLIVHAASYDIATTFTEIAAAVPLTFDEASIREDLLRHVEENVGVDVPYDVRVVMRPPVAAIAELAREAGCDLIVMGAHGRTGLRHFLIGSVTEEVIRCVNVPVIAVPLRAGEHGRVGKVLCPVTFTPECLDALRHAAALVDTRKSPLVLLRSVESERIQDTYDELIRLRDWLPAELRERCEVQIAPREHSVAKIAGDLHADLIALTVPADRTVAETLLGTIAGHVIQESRCPVLVTIETTTRERTSTRVERRISV